MSRSRRWTLVALAVLPAVLGMPPVSAQAPPAEEKWLVDRSLTVTPRPAPVPALQYRLYPLGWDRKDGNAVPIYLRLVHEQSDAGRKYWTETPKPWNQLPVEQIPLAEAHEFLGRMKHFYRQFDLGARRKTADWNYTFDQGSVVDILMPDVAWVRNYVPMMVLRARVELAEGDFAAAARSLATGFSFSRQISEAPLLISGLVGVACASPFADCVADFIERPQAPNLYWALTALPRPLIDLRKAMEFEQRFFEMEIPEFADLDRSRSPEQWDALLKKVRTKIKMLNELPSEGGDANRDHPIAGIGPDDPAANSPDLRMARGYLADRRDLSAATIAAMPPAQVLLLFIVGTNQDLRDDVFKVTYLPYPATRRMLDGVAERLRSTPDSEAKRVAKVFLPAIQKMPAVPVRLDRKIAALRVVEALRLHAAANGGQLPERLDQVTVVPIPDDPGTAKPFEYRRDGAKATLISRIPGEPIEKEGLRYTIALRGK
jgi:hypothetical protein